MSEVKEIDELDHIGGHASMEEAERQLKEHEYRLEGSWMDGFEVRCLGNVLKMFEHGLSVSDDGIVCLAIRDVSMGSGLSMGSEHEFYLSPEEAWSFASHLKSAAELSEHNYQARKAEGDE